MFLNSNITSKPSLVKPIIIVLAVVLIIGGVYTFFSKKHSDDSVAEGLKINSSGLDKDQKIRTVGDVEEVLAKWIDANPQAIINSVANMQRKMAEDQMKNAQKSIGSKKDELFNDKNSPSYSPKGYNVTVVEFFDYNCGYCKKSNPTIEDLIKSDSKVRIIYKELPILGQLSEDISVIALAINIIDSSLYRKFHNAVMNSNAASREDVLKIAQNIGIANSKIESTIKSQKDKIAAMIAANRTLGTSIGINGTPGFVVGEELIPGAVSLEALKEKISEHRKK